MTEKKSFLDSLGDRAKPESFSAEKFEDTKGGGKKWIVLGVVPVVLILLVLTAMYLTGRVDMPDLAGMSLQDAYIWAQKSKVTLAVKSAYSFDADEDVILAQDVTAGENIKKNDVVTVTASLGPDPEEQVAFPDLENMLLQEIEAWINENKLTGIRIETANSDVVPENSVIDYSLTDGTAEVFKRKNRISITISKGPAVLSETITVADFSALKAAAILQWGRENSVNIKIKEAFDRYVAAGNVIFQNIQKGTEIKRNEEITVTISKGKSVTVPVLTAMNKDEASAWARTNNVTLTIVESYTDAYGLGKIFKQNLSDGKTIAEGEEVKIFLSLGRVQVPSFIGKTKLEAQSWQQDVNAKGAGVTLTFTEAYSNGGTAGSIISQSLKNEMADTGENIAFVISKGMQLVVPDFTGKTEAEALELGRGLGIKILLEYQNSEEAERGYVLKQSVAKDSLMSDADIITLTISLGRA